MAPVPRMGLQNMQFNTPSILWLSTTSVAHFCLVWPGMTYWHSHKPRHPPPSKSCVSGSSSAHSWKWHWKHWAVCCTSMARNPYNMHNLNWSYWLYRHLLLPTVEIGLQYDMFSDSPHFDAFSPRVLCQSPQFHLLALLRACMVQKPHSVHADFLPINKKI